jgi:endonuclease/exonuclease/phosphatase (EEP) superfamily protein YafD
VASIGPAERVILLGDWNDVPGSPMHQAVLGAGFSDTWADLRRHGGGFTCCHDENLGNRRASFTQRIDYVFSRGLKPLTVARLGDDPGDRVRGPVHRIWPSDHAGVLARFHKW